MQEQRQKLKPFAPDPAPIPACRVFFEELLKSDLFVKENEETFLITPTCARCNRLFGVGEVKGVEKRGNITKIKINDLTATLNIYTDKVLGLGKFLAFVGNVHERGGAGKKGVLILFEEAEPVDENVRDNWIISTARRTMERVELLRNLSLNLSLEKKALQKKQEKAFSESTLKEALEHYAIDDDKLDFWGSMTINTVKGVWEHYSKTTKEIVLEALEEAGKSSVGRIKLVKELKKKGLMEEWVEEVIDELIVEGRCYEPEVGVLKLVEV
jgi:RPA family protein